VEHVGLHSCALSGKLLSPTNWLDFSAESQTSIPNVGGGGMQIGYARASTREQQLALQVDALRQAGGTPIFEEVMSGAKAERPVLQDLLTQLRAGDVLIIWKLDRLGRSLRHLIEVVTALAQRGVGFKSLHEHIDTTTSSGKLIFHMWLLLDSR